MFRASLRTRLIATLVAALSPVLILALFQAVADIQNSGDIRRQELLIRADDAVDRVEQNLAEAELLLSIYRDQILAGGCAQVLERLEEQRPIFANVVATDIDGNVSCAAKGETGGVLDDPSWHLALQAGQSTLRTNAFYGSLSQDWLIAIFRRATDETGAFSGSVGFGLRAEALGNPLRVDLGGTGIDIAISDRDGRVFGTDLYEQISTNWVAAARVEGVPDLNTHKIDGETYDTVIVPLGAGGVYAVLSRPSPSLISDVMLQPVRSIGLPLLAFLVTLLAVWWAVDELVLKWLRRLTRVASIYGHGNYDVTDVQTVNRAPVEIGELAASLDSMANRVGERELELTEAIAKRDEAVKEIHHRVKNNLQIVSSFLSLEARASDDANTKRVLGNARNRISALSIVHQTLYQHERLDSVELAPFLEGLLTHLRDALGMNDAGVEFDWTIENIVRSSDDAIPLALLILEIVTNAMKHAFDADGGKISVTLTKADDTLQLNISDNGRGLTVDEAPKRKGLGTRLINAFSRQLRAKMTIDAEPGRGYKVLLEIPHTEI